MSWRLAEGFRSSSPALLSANTSDTLRFLRRSNVNFEILGEEARKVSTSFRSEHPEIPWRRMIGLRNILAHRYYSIDHALIWTIIHEKLAPVLDQIRSLIPPLPPAVDES
jgi:uncharacterized protein with HEPN domain